MSNPHELTFDEFSDWHDEVDGVEIRSIIPLPDYVPTHDIHVNVPRLAKTARIGRLQSIKVGIASEGSDYSYSVRGVNSDGSAVTGAMKSRAASRSVSSTSSGEGDDLFPRGRSNIKINISHPDLDSGHLRDPKSWAALLDKGLRHGLKESSKKQLLQPTIKRSAVFFMGKSMDAAVGVGSAELAHDPKLLPLALGYFAVLEGVGFVRNVQDYENSFFRGLPYDRYLTVLGMLQTKRIIAT